MHSLLFWLLINWLSFHKKKHPKHTIWGTRLISLKECQLKLAIYSLNLNVFSTDEPTYWPTDVNKTADLIDFFIGKSLTSTNVPCDSWYDLSSDHSTLILHLERDLKRNEPCYLHNSITYWIPCQNLVKDFIDTNVILKNIDDIITAVEHFNTSVQMRLGLPLPKFVKIIFQCALCQKKANKPGFRLTRSTWTFYPINSKNCKSRTRTENYKANSRDLIQQNRLIILSGKSQNMSWGQSAVNLQPDYTWTKINTQKAEAFANHVSKVFTPN